MLFVRLSLNLFVNVYTLITSLLHKLWHTLPDLLPLYDIDIDIDIEFGFGQPWTEDPKACDKCVVVFHVANMATEVCVRWLPVL